MGFNVRTRARALTHGVKRKALCFSLLPAFALLGAGVSILLAVLCGVYGARTVFAGWFFAPFLETHPAAATAATLLFGMAAVLFLLFFSACRFALQAVFFYRTAPDLFRPHCFLSFPRGARTLYCDLMLILLKCGVFLLLAAPGGVTAGVILLQLRGQGLPPPLFYTGAGIALAQLLCAAAAAFVLNGRYYLTKYLLYLNPLLPARDAIRSSVLLMRGRLKETARCRLGALPWILLRLFWPARPFAFAYTGMLRAVLCETLYAEDKTKRRTPSVRFIIDRRSVFYEKNPTKTDF